VESFEIASELGEAKKIEDHILAELEGFNYGEQDIFAVKLALEEALTNAIKHGNGSDPRRKFHIDCRIDEQSAEIVVADEGDGFDPSSVPDPTAEENLERPSGRGIMLMRAYMDLVEYNDKGNSVRLVRRRRGCSHGGDV